MVLGTQAIRMQVATTGQRPVLIAMEPGEAIDRRVSEYEQQ